jgi:tetratricopeptide (TPR) repeat protein
MKAVCPKCGFSGNIKDELIPDTGRTIGCPKCANKFMVHRNQINSGDTSVKNEPTQIKSPAVRSIPSARNLSKDSERFLVRHKLPVILVSVVLLLLIVFGIVPYIKAIRAEGLRKEGLESVKKGDVLEGIEYYSKALKLDSGNENIYFNRGNAYVMLDRYKEAIEDYDKAIDINPNAEAAIVYFNRGNAYDNLREHDKAIADYTIAISLEPDNPYYYFMRGAVYGLDLDQTELALEDLNRACVLGYDDGCARYIELLNILKGTYQSLMRESTGTIGNIGEKTSEDTAEVCFNRGIIFSQLGMFGDALAAYNKALEKDPNDSKAHFNRGQLYFQDNEYEKAIVDYSEAIRIEPDVPLYYVSRGRCHYKYHRNDKATEDFNKACELGDEEGCSLFRSFR